MSPEHFSPDIREFLGILARHQVRYLIVGGEAVVYHGHVRLTGYLDVFYDLEQQNCSRLFSALRDFWHGAVPGIRDPNELQAPGFVVQFGRPPNRLDLLSSITGVGFEEAWSGKKMEFLAGGEFPIPINYIGIDALIKNKQAVGRPRDLDDLDFLLSQRSRP